MATIAMMIKLPALDDDDDVGVEKKHIVQRDGEPNLKFTGKLIASAAPPSREQDRWREYRVYRTKGGNYIFSRIGRSLIDGEIDRFEANVFEPGTYAVTVKGPDDVDREYTWQDHAMDYFKFDTTAKILYQKLKLETEKCID
jgi:hypothetical protein